MKKKVDKNLKKLNTFMGGDYFKTLPADEQERLTRQATIMTSYSNVLGERINAFV